MIKQFKQALARIIITPADMEEFKEARTGRNNWAAKPDCSTKKRKKDEFNTIVEQLTTKCSAATPEAMAATGERIEEGVAELQEKVRQQGVELAQQSTMIGYPNMGTRVHQQGHPGKRHG